MASPLTVKQQQDIERTWSLVEGDMEGAGFLMFKRLFDVTPEAQKMFKKFADVPREQLESNKHYREHTLNVIKTVQRGVQSLNDVSALSIVLQNLGKRHVSRGIEGVHFNLVGDALLWALEQGLGTEWTEEVKDAWVTLYGFMTNEMKIGMNLA